MALPRKPEHRPAEVTVAVNPRDHRHVLVAYQQVTGAGHDHQFGVRVDALVAWSKDGGETWAVATGTSHKDYLRSLDATVTFDLHGHAFLAYLAIDSIGIEPYAAKNTGAGHNGVFVRRSLDGGRTWEASQATLAEHRSMREAQFEDKGYIVADNHTSSPHAGNLYVGWTRYSLDKTEILLARSADDGKTWSRPMVISTDPGVPRAGAGIVIGFHAAVGPDGTVYAIWTDGQGIVLAVSRDGGQTFEPSRRVVPTTQPFPLSVGSFYGANGFPTIAIDPRSSPHRRLFVTWGDYRFGDIDIMASTSDDGGRTWTLPVRVNDDPKQNGKDQVLSWLAVDPTDGAAYVLFYDRRGDPKNVLPTVTLARSTDGGRTFMNYAWSVTPSDPRQARYGDYNGLAALDGRVYGAWVENVPTSQGTPAQATPSGPAAIRIGIADFRTPGRASGTDPKRRQ